MRSSSYLSTSQTAQMLGLSVGSIQRMVESGLLQAYTTQGGHRRILAASVRSYCQTQGVPVPHPLPAAPGVCIICRNDMAPALRQALQTHPQVHLVSHPMELAGLGEEESAFFMDAHVSWLDWPDLHWPARLRPHARFVVYNSKGLAPEQQAQLARHALLHPGDISVDLVSGFLLGIGSLQAVAPPADTPH